MQAELECEGKVAVGALPTPTQKQLSSFQGNWLEYSAREKGIIVRHVQPVGCPALSAIPCELMALLGILSPEQRDRIPGGEFSAPKQSGSKTAR